MKRCFRCATSMKIETGDSDKFDKQGDKRVMRLNLGRWTEWDPQSLKTDLILLTLMRSTPRRAQQSVGFHRETSPGNRFDKIKMDRPSLVQLITNTLDRLWTSPEISRKSTFVLWSKNLLKFSHLYALTVRLFYLFRFFFPKNYYFLSRNNVLQ